MITINGTYDQHRELIYWAGGYNEKMLEFITTLTPGIDLRKKYPILIMPEDIDKWFEMNCFLGFIKEYYFERNGRDSIYGGTD